ncbi:unnamed protein product [Mytilus coruscus]|uniref:Peptidase A2 domain-containing protein n=1 Tax=Mytilus coruscus TaxID=42192 RepID=A0A6J8EEA2_MYTCO|nr:unnamed protein product [Mytilus coruscus]
MVELAAKTAEYRMVQEEEVQRAKLIEFEHEQKLQMQAQQSELKRIAARKELEIANARLDAYSRMTELIQGQNEEPGASNILQTRVSESNVLPTCIPEISILPTTVMETYLTSTHQNPILYNTNNVPEPNIFNGDPLQYMEWKTSFEMLIDRKGVLTTEKIFYLKKYVGGAARKALEGYFYNNSQTAYDIARKVLKERYGHPFIMQKAFRDKLASWPRIAPKDPIALRDFADFLQGCRDAIPHVPSLSILNDCPENQKLLNKLPDWASVRWNPSFDKFHPSCLHEERPRVRQQSSNVPDSNAVNNVGLKPASSLRVSQNNGQSTSMIVPVWVSHKDKPSRETLTYVLLDTQSDTTFILDDTAASLHIPCKPIRLSLSTMTSQHTIIESSKALAPRKLLIGKENEPYAVKTQLGWSVVGYSDTISDGSSIKGVTHRTSVKELPLCSPKDLIIVLESDFAQDKGHLSKQVSQDDIRFLSIVDNGIHQLDNTHLELPLPFKERPTLPNNKPQAIQRLAHLKRRLTNDHKHYEQYKIFMREILSN